MKSLLCIALGLLVSVAHAQVDQELRVLLNEIRVELNQSHDQRTLLHAREKLKSTLDLLQGSSNPGPIPSPRSNLTCTSRDNDGRDPWVLAVKDPITLQQTKLPSSNIGASANCEPVKRSAVQVRDSYFVCTSKDNDGRDPWTVTHYRDGQLVRKINNLGTLQNCSSALNQAIRSSAAVAFCASKDNDGRAPWMQMSVIAESGVIHTAGSYNSLEQCLSSKNKMKLK